MDYKDYDTYVTREKYLYLRSELKKLMLIKLKTVFTEEYISNLADTISIDDIKTGKIMKNNKTQLYPKNPTSVMFITLYLELKELLNEITEPPIGYITYDLKSFKDDKYAHRTMKFDINGNNCNILDDSDTVKNYYIIIDKKPVYNIETQTLDFIHHELRFDTVLYWSPVYVVRDLTEEDIT